MKKQSLLILLFLAVSFSGWAQTRYESWVRINFNHWLNPKTGIGIELHHRRQSNFLNDEKNILDKPLLNFVRPWIYYRGLRNYILSASPISFFDYHDITNARGQTRSYSEIRSTYGIQRNFNFKEVVNRNRVWYELRFTDISSQNWIFQTRLRIQNTFLLPLWTISNHSRINYNFSNEFFISQRKNLVQFDHNRLFNGLQLRKENFDINLGYQWSRHNSNPQAISRHQVFLNTNIDL